MQLSKKDTPMVSNAPMRSYNSPPQAYSRKMKKSSCDVRLPTNLITLSWYKYLCTKICMKDQYKVGEKPFRSRNSPNYFTLNQIHHFLAFFRIRAASLDDFHCQKPMLMDIFNKLHTAINQSINQLIDQQIKTNINQSINQTSE
jgi:hypothetical protein